MSLITTTEAQAMGIGLSLSTSQLQAMIDREEAEMVRRFGANWITATSVSETCHGGGCSIYLKRQISSVTTITEYLYPGDTAPTTLTSTDYYAWLLEGRIERLPWGTTAATRWGNLVTVSYIPTDDTNLRKQVLTALVQISIDAVAPSATGRSVSGLGYSISNSNGGNARSWDALRGDQYARLGWLSR